MQSHPQRKRIISPASLPPEVWICIFHHATDVPGTLIPDIYSHAALIGSVYNERFHADLRVALVTKRALVRVCKQWWHLAMPYLYQSVYIDQTCCLSSLSRTLADSATSKGTMASTRPLGEYTQRLDIAICDRSVDADTESGYLTTIMEHMPHLTIAVFAPIIWYTSRTDIVDDIVDALHHSAPSLRVLDWSALRLQPSDRRLMDLLAKCTQLRILHYSCAHWSKEIEYSGIPPTVTTLRVRCMLPGEIRSNLPQNSDPSTTQRSKYPALQELILDMIPNNVLGADLLRACGLQLLSVHYYVFRMSIISDMELIAQTCPGLRRLTITSKFNFGPIELNFVFPSVTYLGFNTTRFRQINKIFEKLFAALEQLKSSMPSLQVVQLLNEHDVECLLNAHAKLAVDLLQPYMKDSPFRVEDRDGVLLTGLRSSVSLRWYSNRWSLL